MTQALNLSIFKEYDIRGIVHKDLHKQSVKNIGFALGKTLESNAKVAIAYDIRNHSPQIHEWLISGLNACKVKVFSLGLSATPVSYFANHIQDHVEHHFDLTVMITASHNPSNYNGFKITRNKKPFFGSDITALGQVVQRLCQENFNIIDNPAFTPLDVNAIYIEHLSQKFAHLKTLQTSVILDSANGSAGFLVEAILNRIGLKATHLYPEPDGNFPNHHPDPSDESNLQDLKNRISDHDIGFAFDGDGDRLAVLTQNHNIGGDLLAIIFAKHISNPVVVGEVKCSQVMYDLIGQMGEVHMHKTGHSNIKQKMQQVNANLAAEVSGHLFFADDYYGYDDAIYAFLRVLDLIHQGVDLDQEIAKIPKTKTTPELKYNVEETAKFKIMNALTQDIHQAKLPKIKDIISIDGLRIHFEHGWGLIRASNTTPYLIGRFEATNDQHLQHYQEACEKVIYHYIKEHS